MIDPSSHISSDCSNTKRSFTCIAILLGAPLNAQNLERTGIPYLNQYANVVVFDCMPWLGRSGLDLKHEPSDYRNVVTISSSHAFQQALSLHRPEYAIDFVGLNSKTPEIQAMLVQSGTLFVVQKTGNLPYPSLWRRFIRKIKEQRQSPAGLTNENKNKLKVSDGSLLNNIYKRLESSLILRRSLLRPDVALLAGNAAQDRFSRSARNILWIGSQDYHIFNRLKYEQNNNKTNSPYAVFVDDNMPHASDWIVLGMEAPVTPEIYYSSMRRFFDSIEANWGISVLIAAHPSSRYDKRIDRGFGDRPVIHGRTAELVCSANAVLLHSSTSVSFAVLAKKPLLFLTTSELSPKLAGLCIKTMASELGNESINIDEIKNPPSLSSLNPNTLLYAKYKENYLINHLSTESLPWQIFINFLQCQNTLKNQYLKY